GALTSTDIAGDPVLYDDLSPREMSMKYVFLFFFQAEDGIRDLIVTGVQTCALPISVEPHDLAGRLHLRTEDRVDARELHEREHRSEERRVGKECRLRRLLCL